MNYEENNKNNNKKKNTILIVIMATLVVILGGVTYAFFNYTRTGETNLLTVGSISFNSTQETVNLTNLFPVRSEELDEYIENVDKISVSITGNTDYEEGLEYRMSFVDVNNSFFDKTVPLSYRATATNIGTPISNNEYDLSKGGTTQVYSMNETGVIENDNYFLTGYIPTGVNANGTVEIAAYIDGNKIAITDTYNNYHTTDTCFTFNNGTITNYDANCEKDVVIPSMINNIQVTSIADNAFKGKQLKSVVIPDTVTSIGNNAFENNNLTSIKLSNNLTTIGSEAFQNNKLTSVTIPKGCEVLNYAFKSNSIQKIILGETGTGPIRIYSGAFFLEGKYYIENNKLAIIVNKTGQSFNWGSILQDEPEANSEFVTGTYTLGTCTVDIVEEDTYPSIGNVSPPTRGTSSSWVNGRTVFTTNEWNNFGTNGNISFKIKVEAVAGNLPKVMPPFTNESCFTTSGNTITDYDASCGTVVSIPNTINGTTITTIGERAFNNKGLTSVYIPDSITTISMYAFSYNNIETLQLGSGVTTIGYQSFISNKIKMLQIGPNVTTIEYGSFSYNDLRMVQIGKGVREIDGDAFYSDPADDGSNVNLRTIDNLTNKPFDWGEIIGNESKTFITGDVTISDYTVTITNSRPNTTPQLVSESCFTTSGSTITDYNTSCGGSYIIIPSTINGTTITEIGSYAFSSKYLKSVVIPDSVTTIGYNAFSDSNIETLQLGSGVTTIGEEAFANNNIETIEIGPNVTTIESRAFKNNDLVSVQIGEHVTQIYSEAFYSSPDDGGSNTRLRSIDNRSNRPFDWGEILGTESKTFVTGEVTISDYTVTITNSNASTSPQLVSESCFTTSDGRITDYDMSCGGNIIIPSTINGTTITEIGNYAFDSKYLTGVIIPDTVTSIGTWAFYGNDLTTATIGSGVTRIGSGAFFSDPEYGDGTNVNLRTIINKTNRSFDWMSVLNGHAGGASTTFVTGQITIGSYIINITNN